MLDAFGREIKASLDELQAALVESTKQTKASTEASAEGAQELKKLNTIITALIGKELNVELEQMNKLLGKVKDNYEDQEKILKKNAGTAKNVSKETESLTKNLDDSGDKIAKFSERLSVAAKEFTSGGLFSVQLFMEKAKDAFGTLDRKLKMPLGDRAFSFATKMLGGLDDAISIFGRSVGRTYAALRGRRPAATNVAAVAGGETGVPIPEAPEPKDKALFSLEKELKDMPEVSDLQDLCRCICLCLGHHFKKVEKNTEDTSKAAKAEAIQMMKGGGATWKTRMAAKLPFGLGQHFMSPEQYKQSVLMNEYLRDQKAEAAKAAKDRRKEFNARLADRAKAAGQARGMAISQTILSERPGTRIVESIWPKIAAAGGSIFSFAGDLAESIPIVGGALKAVGHALGGFAEGIISSVLNPIVEQATYFSDAMEAMFISRGAANLAPVINMGGPPPPGGGEEWSTITKRSAEFANNIDAASRAMEVFVNEMVSVEETGQSFATIQKTIANNFKRGIRDAKEVKTITKASLQTATLIGANAEHTAELFADWHQKLGMSGSDLRIMQTNLRDVARNTGLFGDALIQVARRSEEFMRNMRVAGNLTTTAARNITELVARGQLTGTEAATSRLLGVLSKGVLRGGGGPQEQALAAIGGGKNLALQQKALYGTLLDSEDDVRDFAKNLEEWGKRIVKANPGESFAKALERLTPEQRAIFSAVFEQSIGVGAEEFRIVIDNLNKTGMSFNQRLAEINKQTISETAQRMSLEKIRETLGDKETQARKTFDEALGKASGDTSKALQEVLKIFDLPPDVRKTIEGQIGLQQAQFQKQELFLSTSTRLLDEFNKNLEKEGANFQSAIAPLTNKASYQEYIQAIGSNFKDGGEAMEKALLDQAKILEERATGLGMEDVKKILPTEADIRQAIEAARGGDRATALKNIATRFSDIQGAIALQAKRAADPLFDISQILKQIQAEIMKFLQSKLWQGLQLLGAALENLKKQPFWKAFAKGPEGFEEGFKLLGQWIKDLPKNIDQVFAQMKSIANMPGFQLFITGLLKGFAEFNKKLFEMLGDVLMDASPKLGKFFKDLIKTFEETDWGAVGENLGILIATLVAPETIAGIASLVVVISTLADWGETLIKIAKDPSFKTYKDYVILNKKEAKEEFDATLALARANTRGIGEGWIELGNMVIQFNRGFFAILRGDWEGLWDAITSGFGSMFTFVKKAFLGFFEFVVSQMENLKIAGKNIIPGTAALREQVDAMTQKLRDEELADAKEKYARVAARKEIESVDSAFVKRVKKSYDDFGIKGEKVISVIGDHMRKEWSGTGPLFEAFEKSKDIGFINLRHTQMVERLQEYIRTQELELYSTQDEARRKEILANIAATKDDVARLNIAKEAILLRLKEQEAIETQKRLIDEMIKSGQVKLTPGKFFTPEQATTLMRDLAGTGRAEKEAIFVKELGDPEKLKQAVAQSTIAQKVAENRDPTTRKVMAETFIGKLEKYLDENKNISNEEYLNTLEEISILKKFTEQASKPGSIFVYDVHMEDTFETIVDILTDMNDGIYALQEAERVTAMPTIPVSAVEEEMKRKYAETQDPKAEEMSQIETNTRDTAITNRQIVGALRAMGRLMARKRSSGLMNTPDMEDAVFYEELINTEWPGGRDGSVVGFELQYTDYA